MKFEVIDRDHPQRALVEAQIRSVYGEAYGANLGDFPSRLVALFDDDGQPMVAAGLRTAADGYFSEHYLDEPVEAALSHIWRRPVAREQIAEISNLAGCQSGASMILMQHVTKLFQEEGITWAVFTATTRLRAMLRRTGCPALDICAADKARVDNPADWGSYYDTNPRVCAVHYDMLSPTVRSKSDDQESVAVLA